MLALLLGNWAGTGTPLLYCLFFTIAAAVAWSRINLRMHDAVDVGAGAVIGLLVGIALLHL